jgi:hypothetical protein
MPVFLDYFLAKYLRLTVALSANSTRYLPGMKGDVELLTVAAAMHEGMRHADSARSLALHIPENITLILSSDSVWERQE